MSSLTLGQMRDLTDRLNQLSEISKARDTASAEHTAANRRWNNARNQYAEKYAELVALYGEEYAPTWLESIHGPRITAPAPRPSAPTGQINPGSVAQGREADHG